MSFHGAVFSYGAVRFGWVRFYRTESHGTILPFTKPHRTAPHRTVRFLKIKIRTKPHRSSLTTNQKREKALGPLKSTTLLCTVRFGYDPVRFRPVLTAPHRTAAASAPHDSQR